MNNRILKKIWICSDVWMDILPFFGHAQLGLKLALLSPRFEVLVDTHFKGKREFTIWKWIQIRKDQIAEKPVLFVYIDGIFVPFPLPDRPLPNKICFKHLQIEYIDYFVVEFLRSNKQIWDKRGTKLEVEMLSSNLAHFCALNIRYLSDPCGDFLDNLRRLISPTVLTDLTGLNSIDSFDLRPDAIGDDGPNATVGQALSKWLHTPRKDGQPKQLMCSFVNDEAPKAKAWVNNFKESFLRATTSSASYNIPFILYPSMPIIEPFELVNEQTKEKLILREGFYHNWLLKRCPIIGENPKNNILEDNLNNVIFVLYGNGPNDIGELIFDGIARRKKKKLSSADQSENQQQIFADSFVKAFGSKRRRRLRKIWICNDVWMDILLFFDRPQLGLKLAFLSPLVDTHFNGKRELTIRGLIKVCKDNGMPKQAVFANFANSDRFPLPNRPLPNKIRFKYLCIKFVIREPKRQFWFFQLIISNHYLDILRRFISPTILTDLNNLNSIDSGRLLPDLLVDDLPNATGGHWPNETLEWVNSFKEKLFMCYGAAAGLDHVHSKGILHCDIAARNCLFSENTVKVADFGLAFKGPSKPVETGKPVPIRWLSPETMRERTFTPKSDTWAYGVLCWEIFCNAQQPYQFMSNNDVAPMVLRGTRLRFPNVTPPPFAEFIRANVWTADDARRYSMRDVLAWIEQHIDELIDDTTASRHDTTTATTTRNRGSRQGSRTGS
ncbi:hypothetical protein niasHT_021576 [Heterodera trifolii]|uniref:Protein kinase domain-containing protein n=1 Tax=Heterodera trifolii TaxID=157864 RepID=A0ABD2KS13_9BILA